MAHVLIIQNNNGLAVYLVDDEGKKQDVSAWFDVGVDLSLTPREVETQGIEKARKRAKKN